MKLMLVASENVQVTSTIFRNRFVETLYAPIYRSRAMGKVAARGLLFDRIYKGTACAQHHFIFGGYDCLSPASYWGRVNLMDLVRGVTL